jgi:hypothetical protein
MRVHFRIRKLVHVDTDFKKLNVKEIHPRRRLPFHIIQAIVPGTEDTSLGYHYE